MILGQEKRLQDLRMQGGLPAAQWACSSSSLSPEPGMRSVLCSLARAWLISVPASESKQHSVTFPSLLRIFLTERRIWQMPKYSLTSTLTIVSFGKAQLLGCLEWYRLLLQPTGTALVRDLENRDQVADAKSTALIHSILPPIIT